MTPLAQAIALGGYSGTPEEIAASFAGIIGHDGPLAQKFTLLRNDCEARKVDAAGLEKFDAVFAELRPQLLARFIWEDSKLDKAPTPEECAAALKEIEAHQFAESKYRELLEAAASGASLADMQKLAAKPVENKP